MYFQQIQRIMLAEKTLWKYEIIWDTIWRIGEIEKFFLLDEKKIDIPTSFVLLWKIFDKTLTTKLIKEQISRIFS